MTEMNEAELTELESFAVVATPERWAGAVTPDFALRLIAAYREQGTRLEELDGVHDAYREQLGEIERLRAAHNECDEALEHVTKWGEGWERDYQEVFTSNARLRAALQDFRDQGLRADLNPTSDGRDSLSAIGNLYNYLARVDGHVRERAREALGGSV